MPHHQSLALEVDIQGPAVHHHVELLANPRADLVAHLTIALELAITVTHRACLAWHGSKTLVTWSLFTDLCCRHGL